MQKDLRNLQQKYLIDPYHANHRRIMLECSSEANTELTLKDVKTKGFEATPKDQKWRCDLIKELIAIRDKASS